MTYKTKGIVLKYRAQGESDRVYTIYTEDYGKIEVVAKGSQKIQNKLAGHLLSTNSVELMIARSKVQDKLAGAKLIKSFFTLGLSLESMEVAGRIISVLDRLVKFNFTDRRIFLLLDKSFDLIKSNAGQSRLIFILFCWQLVSEMGNGLELFDCVVCRRRIIPNENKIDFLDGGVVCSHCCSSKRCLPGDVSASLIKILRLLQTADLDNFHKLFRIKIGKKLLDELSVVTDRYLNYTAGSFRVD